MSTPDNIDFLRAYAILSVEDKLAADMDIAFLGNSYLASIRKEDGSVGGYCRIDPAEVGGPA